MERESFVRLLARYMPHYQRQRLWSRHADTGESEDVMSNKDIMKAGAKAFKKIHNQVQ